MAVLGRLPARGVSVVAVGLLSVTLGHPRLGQASTDGARPLGSPHVLSAEPLEQAPVAQGYVRTGQWRSVREPLSADRQLEWPTGHGVGGLGIDHRAQRLLATDTSEHVIRVYAFDGTYERSIGAQGSALGEFSSPRDVAAISGVGIVVSDTGNDRIQVLDYEGTAVASWRVLSPRGLLVQQGGFADPQISVVSASDRTLYTYSASGELQQETYIGDTSSRGLPKPTGLSAAGSWVSDAGIGEVRLVSPGSSHTATLLELSGVEAAAPIGGSPGFALAAAPDIGIVPANGFRRPGRYMPFHRVHDLEIGPSGQVLAAVEPHGLAALDDPSSTIQDLMTSQGQLVLPSRIAVAGNVLLADALPRLQIWDAAGTPLRSLELDVEEPTERSFPPADVAASGDSQYALLGAYSLDSTFAARIYSLSDGTLVRRWPVYAVAIAASGDHLAVLDLHNQEVSIYHEPTGAKASWSLASSGYRAAMDVALAPDAVYLANYGTGELEAWSRTGALTDCWPVMGGAIRVAAGPNGRAFVLSGAEWVHVYDSAGVVTESWSVREPSNSAADIAVDDDGRVFIAYRDDLVAVYESGAASPGSATSAEGSDTCAILTDKQAAPRELDLGDSTTVELRVLGRCPGPMKEVDAVLVVDVDDYDSDPWLPDDHLSAIKRVAVSIAALSDPARWHLGVVTGGRDPLTVSSLSDSRPNVITSILDLHESDERHALAAGIRAAADLLKDEGRPDAGKAVIVLANSTPVEQLGLDPAIAACSEADIGVFTVAVGPQPDSETLRRIASHPTAYFSNPTNVELRRLVRAVDDQVGLRASTGLLATATLTDVVPSNMTYLVGSGQPHEPAYDDATRTLTWALDEPVETTIELSYRLRPEIEGTWPTNVSATLSYTDALGSAGMLAFPVPYVRVNAPHPTPTTPVATTATPTATPTQTPAPTDTAPSAATSTTAATQTATPTSAPSATPSPTTTSKPTRTLTLTPTRRPPPQPVYLPIGLRESCPPKDLYLDVALVIDASTSMLDITAVGSTKLELAVESVGLFLDNLRLEPGRDRAAIVTFNDRARTIQRLTSEREALTSALRRISTANHSRLDLGVERAMVELIARGNTTHLQAMVVLSDGKANPVPGDEAVAAAKRARLEGITIYVVGLGPSMDERVLRGMTSGDDRYVAAPDPATIPSIYRDLTQRVACPPEVFWGRR